MDRFGGVVLGDFFCARPLPLDASQVGSPGDVDAAARWLSRNSWGAYIALWPELNGERLSVYRDSSGALGAMAWGRAGLALVSDDITHLPASARPARLSLDWDIIAEIVRRPYTTTHLAPLAGLQMVAPGDRASISEGAVTSVAVWRPADFVREPAEVEMGDFRAKIVETVSTIAALEPRLVLEVSGGLDSSIVAACLHSAGLQDRIVAAVNYFPQQREGDERSWARDLCESQGLPFEAIPRPVGDLAADDFAELVHHAGPAFAGLDVSRDRDAEVRGRQLGATASFGGQGGDALFYQMPNPAVVADFIRDHGRSAWCDPFVQSIARWLRRSMWSVLREARKPGAPGPDPTEHFWGPRARTPSAVPAHPWLQDIEDLPPGKRLQLQALVGSLEHWDRSRRANSLRVVQPLLSQPIVEMCLRIPTWRLLDGGRDRAFARAAFAPLLPTSLVTRRSKGALGVLYTQRAAASLPFLREHLLGGVLVSAGVLNGEAIDAALQPEALIWRGDGAHLTRAVVMESWVRYWQGQVPDLATAPRSL